MAALVASAPKAAESLCEPCAAHFAAVRAHLDALGVPYRIAPTLVRGLDYYTRTAFEFYLPGREGQQQALGGGGRYDGLVELLGGRPTPGIGFAIGLDRTVLALAELGRGEPPAPGPLAVVVGAEPDDTVARLVLATDLRAAGLSAAADLGRRRLARQLDAAARAGAHFAVIVGVEDGGTEAVALRDLEAGTQRIVAREDLVAELRRAARTHRHGGGAGSGSSS